MSPTLFTFIVLGGGLLVSEAGTVTLLVLFSLFSAAAAINLPALGGAAITPAVLFLPFVVTRAVLKRMRGEAPYQLSRAGMWFALLVLYGIVGAIVLPRVFEGRTAVMVLDRFSDKEVQLYPPKPLATNLTQSVYAVGQLACFLALRTLLDRPGALARFRDAVLLVASLDVVAAFLNVGEYYVGLPPVLDFVRTAEGYSMAIEYEMGGLVRIHGTFSEASLFAYYTLPLMAFCLSLLTSGVRPRYTGPLTLLLLGLLLASTSGTAYIGLAGYGLVYAVAEIRARKLIRLRALTLVALCSAAAVLAIYTLELEVADKITAFFQSTVFDKASSGSGEERSSWDRQAFINFLDTYGIGAGLGSARASSYPLVLLSNVGVVGTLLFLLFTTNVLWTPRCETAANTACDDSVQRAAHQAVLAALVGAALAVGMFDLGVSFFIFAAVASMPPERAGALAEPGRG